MKRDRERIKAEGEFGINRAIAAARDGEGLTDAEVVKCLLEAAAKITQQIAGEDALSREVRAYEHR